MARNPPIAATLLPDPGRLRLEYIRSEQNSITMVVATTADQAVCPRCQQASRRRHSRYRRMLADLPWNGVAVRLQLESRRFFCPTPTCARRIFTERLPGIVAPYARRTMRLTQVLEVVGFALGGEAGARVLAQLTMAVSPDTVLRVLRRAVLPSSATPRVLGIDDFAFRRGRRYGTLLVDLERHCPVDLLPDRAAATVASWLRDHPGVEIVTRDRAEAYAEGIRQGAPEAVQVADRFHLVLNVSDALYDLFNRQRRHLPEIGSANEAQSSEDQQNGCWVGSDGTSPLVGSQTEREAQQTRRTQRRDRYDRLLALREQGVSIAEAAAQVGIGKRTAQRWITAGGFPERKVRRRSASSLDAYQEYIQRRWNEGCHNRTQIWREIGDQGYRGSYMSVYQYLVRLQVGAVTTGGGAHAPPRSWRLSPRQATWLLLRREDTLDAQDRQRLAVLREGCADAQVAYPLVQDFLALIRERKHAEFDRWVRAARESGLAEVERFAVGLQRDEAAVRAALRLKHSNGQTEGRVNKLKLLKRQMYGRGGFDLLRQRVLHAA